MTDVSRWMHRCSEMECPFVGQVTRSGCRCHVGVDAMMATRIKALESALGNFFAMVEGECPTLLENDFNAIAAREALEYSPFAKAGIT